MSDEKKRSGAGNFIPLLLGGLVLGAFGFYMAISHDSAASSSGKHAKAEAASAGLLPEDLDTTKKSQKFELKGMEPTMQMKMSQSSIRMKEGAPDALLTKVNLTITDEVKNASDGQITVDRSYSDVAIQVEQNGKPALEEISPQVAQLLDTATHQLSVTSTGEVKQFKLTSSPSAQMRQMMAILKDATIMSFPRFAKAEVVLGESWSHEAPYRAGSDDDRVAFTGSYTMANMFVGTVKRDGRELAVIKQDINGTGKGLWKDVQGKTSDVTSHGLGTAVWFVDTTKGTLVSSNVQFEQVTTAGGGLGVQTTTTVELSALK